MKKTYTTLAFTLVAFWALAQVPTNDNCANAKTITAGNVESFSTLEATTDGPFHPDSPCPSAVNDTLFRDIWYTYTATFDGLLDFSLCNTANFDTKIAVYKPGTTCPAQDGDLLTCNDDGAGCGSNTSRVIFGVNNGETYLLRVGGYGESGPGQAGTGTFIVSQFTPTLSNDFCDQAKVMTEGLDQPISTIGATTDGPSHPGNSTCFGFGDATVQADIWYTYTAPTSGSLLWSTCNSINFDSRMAVYKAGATCPLLNSDLLACNDDGSGCLNFTSKLYFDVEQGQTYLMRIGGYGGDAGNGTFDLILSDPPPPPANDLCANAIPVNLVTPMMADDFEGQIDGTTLEGTFDTTDYIFPNAQCFGTNVSGGEFSDVWYQFNTLGNTELELRFYNGGDQSGSFYAELFNSCDMPVDTNEILGSCVFVDPTTTFASTIFSNLPPVPTIYLMRVTTRLTTQLPGDFFFFIVSDSITSGARQRDLPGSYQIFPNPTGDKLYLNLMLNESASTQVSILNAIGQTVHSENIGNVSAGDHQFGFEVGSLPSGVYFLQLRAESGVGVVKFIKD